jgi:hypothetical protein
MKRMLIVAAILISALSLGSCKKEDDECKALANDVNYAAALYASNPTNAQNCGFYKQALTKYLNSSACANKLSATDRQSFQTQLNNLNC